MEPNPADDRKPLLGDCTDPDSSTEAVDEPLQEPPLRQRHTAVDISHPLPLEGESNARSILTVDWKCNTEVCGLADTRSVAATAERSEATKKLSRAVCFCVVFMILEIVGGIEAGSLAILTDAVHLSSDVASFAISLCAVWAGGWEADDRHTFGFYRAEVLGALISILIIWVITVCILYEAVVRLFTHQAPIDGRLMFIVASLGLLVNLVMMLLLGHGKHGHGHGHDHEEGHAHSHEHPDAHEQIQRHEHGSDNSHDHADHRHRHDEESPSLARAERPYPNADVKSSDPDEHRLECKRLNLVVRGYQEVIVCVCDEEERPFERKRTVESTSSGHEAKCLGSSKMSENVNVRSAYLHVLGDLVQSIGVMVGGAVIWWKPEWMIVDLLCTFLFSLLVLLTTVKMVCDVLAVLMESAPREIDAKALRAGLVQIDGVDAVHELHIWAITVGKVMLACHVTIKPDAESDEVLQKVIYYCDSRFKISHVTIQIERKRPEQEARQHYPSNGHGHDHDHHHGHDHDNHDHL